MKYEKKPGGCADKKQGQEWVEKRRCSVVLDTVEGLTT